MSYSYSGSGHGTGSISGSVWYQPEVGNAVSASFSGPLAELMQKQQAWIEEQQVREASAEDAASAVRAPTEEPAEEEDEGDAQTPLRGADEAEAPEIEDA